MFFCAIWLRHNAASSNPVNMMAREELGSKRAVEGAAGEIQAAKVMRVDEQQLVQFRSDLAQQYIQPLSVQITSAMASFLEQNNYLRAQLENTKADYEKKLDQQKKEYEEKLLKQKKEYGEILVQVNEKNRHELSNKVKQEKLKALGPNDFQLKTILKEFKPDWEEDPVELMRLGDHIKVFFTKLMGFEPGYKEVQYRNERYAVCDYYRRDKYTIKVAIDEFFAKKGDDVFDHF